MTHQKTGSRPWFALRARSGKAVVIAAVIGAIVVAALAWLLTAPKDKAAPVSDTAPVLSPQQEAASQAQGEANLGDPSLKDAGGDAGSGPSGQAAGEGNLAPSGGYR